MAKKPSVRNEAVPLDEEQPTRNGLPEPTREFDQTFLDPDSEIIHRDYIAHAFRWGFAKRNFIQHDKSVVLDVGCGPDKPLFAVLFGGIGGGDGGFPKAYVGVDLNKVKPTRHKRTTLYPETNFFTAWPTIKEKHGPFDLVTNFEVIEHMPRSKGLELLELFYNVLKPGGVLLLSTPVYDGVARARNHIHEWGIEELQAGIEAAGLEVEERYGTFANINDVKPVMSAAEREVWQKLKRWFGNDVLANFIAPLHPDQARNNTWVCRRPE